MNIGPCQSNDHAVTAIRFLRDHAPFKYGGTWYVAAVNGQGLAYRNKAALVKRLRKESPSAAVHHYVTVSPVIRSAP